MIGIHPLKRLPQKTKNKMNMKYIKKLVTVIVTLPLVVAIVLVTALLAITCETLDFMMGDKK